MLRRSFAVALILILAVFVFVARQPDQFHVARRITIDAPAGFVFTQIDDLHNFQRFSPWAKRDLSAKTSFAGPQTGSGATFTWAGNGEVGKGRMTIIESRHTDLVRIRLDFLEPFASTAISQFTLAPEGDRTTVEWSITGGKNFFAKALHLVLDMDQMIGRDFEKGLADLKSIAEGR